MKEVIIQKSNREYTNSHCKLTYAYNAKGELVFVDDVPNGNACGCFCPKCKEPLMARNGGKKNQHHFAHSPESNCQGSYETTLHLLAKEIIKEEKKMVLPEYEKRCVFNPEKDYLMIPLYEGEKYENKNIRS